MKMIHKGIQKLFRQLNQKKYRDNLGLFMVERTKVVDEILGKFPCRLLCATHDYLLSHPQLPAEMIREVTEEDLSKVSELCTSREVVAVFEKPKHEVPKHVDGLVLALDDVQDPGNLGTIVRIADWFGIRDIVASRGTADVWSPKVVQATMGALARVRVTYVNDLPEWLKTQDVPVYGTFLNGENIYTKQLSSNGIIVMGNEGNGISPAVARQVTENLLVPSYPAGDDTSESLNVAVATALVVGEFRRRMIIS